MNSWLFLLVGVTILGAAWLAVSLRNLIHSVLSLIVVFVGTAAIYVGLEAPFIAGVQILIYVGAIAILLLFALMLIRPELRRERWRLSARQWLGLGVSLPLLAILVTLSLRLGSLPPPPGGVPTVEALGTDLLSRWVVPFEVASLLLTAAMVGAIAIAIEGQRKREGSDR